MPEGSKSRNTGRERRTTKPIECFFTGAVSAAGPLGAHGCRRAGYSSVEIAVFLAMHPTTVRRMVKRLAGPVSQERKVAH
jgi:hypothetical protein